MQKMIKAKQKKNIFFYKAFNQSQHLNMFNFFYSLSEFDKDLQKELESILIVIILKYINQIVDMESTDSREPIVLHQVPSLAELQVKALIIKALPEALLRTEDILLRKKEGKYQAFLMVPSAKLEDICSIKEVIVGGQKVYVKRWFVGYQLFVGRLPESLSSEEVISAISAQFGKISKFEEVSPFQGSKNKLKHLYIRFESDSDAQKCLFSPKRLIVKDIELKVARPYSVGQNQETDKKLFLKVVSVVDNQQDLQICLNAFFSKQGTLRQPIRIEGGRTNVVLTSTESVEKVLKGFKGSKIGKYDVIIRPYASTNTKDNVSAFLGNISSNIDEADLQKYLHEYEPIISCKIMTNNPRSINASVTFANDDSVKRFLAEYRTNDNLRPIFSGTPYATYHMSAKERNEYNKFRNGNDKKKNLNPNRPFGMPNGLEQPFGMFAPGQFPMPFPQGMPPMGVPGMGMNLPVNMPMNIPMRMPLPQYRKVN